MTHASTYTSTSLALPSARISGRIITRLEERHLGWTVLNATTADKLGREQLGWFIGSYPGIVRAAKQLSRLDGNIEGGVWVVVLLSRDMSRELFALWPNPVRVAEPPTLKCSAWRSSKVWVAIPEDLKYLLPIAVTLESGVAGVIILDPECFMYKSRGGTDRRGETFLNDRPQHVVNFRASLEIAGWQPPILFLTSRPAKSVNTENVARAFCLNAFQFIAGDSFGCWDRPIDEGEFSAELSFSHQI